MIKELRQILPLRLHVSTIFLFLMWAFYQVYQPWETVDHDLLQGTGYFDNATDLSEWQRVQGVVHWSDETGFVKLNSSTRLRFPISAIAGDWLLASGKIKTDALTPGKKKWDAARILVYFEDVNGKINWSYPHNVGFMSASRDWQTFTVSLKVPLNANKGWIELAHYGRNGEASFDDVIISPALKKTTAVHWQMFFGMVWAAMMMWLVLNTHLWDLPWGKAVLITALFIIVGVALPPATMFQVANNSAKISQQILEQASELLPDSNQIEPQKHSQTARTVKTPVNKLENNPANAGEAKTGVVAEQPVDKNFLGKMQNIGHTFLFAVLGFFITIGFLRELENHILGYSVALFVVSTEVLQLVVDGRHFVVSDLIWDFLGLVIGGLLALTVMRVRR